MAQSNDFPKHQSSLTLASPTESNLMNASKHDRIKSCLMQKVSQSEASSKTLFLGDSIAADDFEEMAFIGYSVAEQPGIETGQMHRDVYLNTNIPFCMVAVGVQGTGKSHSLGCFLESCLLSNQDLTTNNIIRLHKPMTTLVLHYDLSPTSICEASGLLKPSNTIKELSASFPKTEVVILVSPTYYRQRKQFYGNCCDVRPLLFRWQSLTADHITRFMRITSEDNQLYVASFMNLLRKYQRQNEVPVFAKFINEVKEICNVRGQSGPLIQRITLLESIIAESAKNRDIMKESLDLTKAVSMGKKLLIVDLTDPLLSREEANGLFQVVTEHFRSLPVDGGKMLALDEAHKFMDGDKSDGLSQSIVNIARLMRHDGIRLAVSTQSPLALAPELLELVSVALLHHFHSRNWWEYLRQKLPLNNNDFDQVLGLASGHALVFCSKHNFSASQQILKFWLRDRLTADLGESRTSMKNTKHLA